MNNELDQFVERLVDPVGIMPPSYDENAAKILERDNTLINIVKEPDALQHKLQAPSPTFNPAPYVGESENFDNFIRAHSIEEVEDIRRRIAEENQLTKEIQQIPDVDFFLGTTANQIWEPLNYIGIPIPGGASTLNIALRTAISGGASLAGQEAILHGSQLTRSWEESAYNVAAGALLSGILGGAIGHLSRKEKIQARDDIKELLGFTEGSRATIGAAQSPTDASGSGFVKVKKGVMGGLGKIPSVRTGYFISDYANQAFEKLTYSTNYRQKNLKGIRSEFSAETNARVRADSDRNSIVIAFDNAYNKYKSRVKSEGGKPISREEFGYEVTRTGHMGDVSPDVKEAFELSTEIREKLFNRYHEDFKNLGFDIGDQTTDEFYWPRAWSPERIKADQVGFKKALATAFEAKYQDTLTKIREIEKKYMKSPVKGKKEVPLSQVSKDYRDIIWNQWLEELKMQGGTPLYEKGEYGYVPKGFADKKIEILYEEYKNKNHILKERLLDKEKFKEEVYSSLYHNLDGKEIKDLEFMYNYMEIRGGAEVGQSAENAMKSILGMKPEAQYNMGSSLPKSTKARTLNIAMSDDLMKFVNPDAQDVALNHSSRAIKNIEVASQFGGDLNAVSAKEKVSRDYSALRAPIEKRIELINEHLKLMDEREVEPYGSALGRLRKTLQDLIDSGKDPTGEYAKELSDLDKYGKEKFTKNLESEKEKLNKENRILSDEEKEFQELFQYYLDYVSGKPMGEIRAEKLARFGSALRNYSAGVSLSNIPISGMFTDPYRIIAANGISQIFGKAIPDIIASFIRATITSVPKDLKNIGIALNSASNNRVANAMLLNNQFSKENALEKGIKIGTQGVFRWSGANWWSDFIEMFSSSLYSQSIIDAGEKLASGGTLSKKRLADFAAYGLNKNDIIAITEQFKQFGKKTLTEFYLNLDNWTDKEAAGRMAASLNQAVQNQTSKRSSTSVPRILQDTEAGRWMNQFGTWFWTSTNEIFHRASQQMSIHDARALTTIVGLSLVGALQYATKEKVRENFGDGKKADLSAYDLIYHGLTEGGALGVLPVLLEKFDSVNELALQSLFGYKSRRAYPKSYGSLISGPAGDTAQNIFKVIMDPLFGKADYDTVHSLRRLGYMQNQFILKKGFDALEEQTVDTLGLPTKEDRAHESKSYYKKKYR